MRFYLSVSITMLLRRGPNGKGSIPRNKGAFPTCDPFPIILIIDNNSEYKTYNLTSLHIYIYIYIYILIIEYIETASVRQIYNVY